MLHYTSLGRRWRQSLFVEGRVSLCVSNLLSIWVPLGMNIQLNWKIWLWQDKPYASCVIIILVKSLQMIWVYITSFKVCQSFCQFLCLCLWKIRISLYNGAVTLTLHFGGTWNCSRQENLVAIKKGECVSKFKGIPNLTERLNIFSLEKNWISFLFFLMAGGGGYQKLKGELGPLRGALWKRCQMKC